jgi:enoyl-CoA hydratase
MNDDGPRTRYENPAYGVARIVLSRPEMWNAQDTRMLYELDADFQRAALDDDIRVVIVAGDGEHFSSCHGPGMVGDEEGMKRVTLAGGFTRPGVEGTMAYEEEAFLGLCWRWRNFPKPTIAQVQGRAWAGGLMLVWPCDLIVASEDMSFSDPVIGFGMSGHEYFVHAFEMNARQAKEFLYTGREILADEAFRIGMVNRVVPREDLESATLELALEIAQRPSFALRLAKAAVNQATEAQGLWNSLQTSFSLHQLGHAQMMLTANQYIDERGWELSPNFGPPKK